MPAVEIRPNEKFAALALTELPLRDELASVDLGDGLWATGRPPVNLGAVWNQWLGTILTRELERANLWLVAKLSSRAPSVLDAENETLKERVGYLFHALLLARPMEFGLALRLTGGSDGAVQIRGFEYLDKYFHTQGLPALLTLDDLQEAKRIMDGLVILHADNAWSRVSRGLQAFWNGLKERYVEDRLHEFARSLEGVTKPEIGATRSQFTHRCQTFTGASPGARQILEEAYDIRSQVEHLHDWRQALQHLSADVRESTLMSHVRRMETLSRQVYQRLATIPQTRDLFRNDQIDGFWGLRDDERRPLWGTTLDITSIT